MVATGPVSLVLRKSCFVLSKASVFQSERVFSISKLSKTYLRSSLECFGGVEIRLEVNDILGSTTEVLLLELSVVANSLGDGLVLAVGSIL
jgi:hypothetical protein